MKEIFPLFGYLKAPRTVSADSFRILTFYFVYCTSKLKLVSVACVLPWNLIGRIKTDFEMELAEDWQLEGRSYKMFCPNQQTDVIR